MLYQGGAEIAFEMPAISRDMIVIIQGLVILFAGALENMFRPAISAFFGRVTTSEIKAAPEATGESH
jgi:simple sugar transport system permease protein